MVQSFVAQNRFGLRTQTARIGRKSDGVRTQNAATSHRPKLCRLFEFGSNIKIFGRIGRKIPEHLVVASGQWLVARFEAHRHLAVSLTRVPVPYTRDAKHQFGTVWDASIFGFASRNKSC